ncbi:PREDICTED: uncharacterized protein LOC108618746 [Drosophila arizonae]|uniref:Uncharacterized protein LOC108618746 n=1 Tax=Drosophila arizonae TaxID=7263 RepID=A0ABM1PT18_DROAR|nr:PREDICTED: uncharacterized protein LOC108618746 [Drosophila arizonae]
MVPVAKKPTIAAKRTLRSTTRAQTKQKLDNKNASDERINEAPEKSEEPSTSMGSTRSTKVKLTKKRKEVAERPNAKHGKRSQTKQLLINNNNNSHSHNNNNNNNTKNNKSNNNNNIESLLIEPLPMERYKLLKAFCMQVSKSDAEPQQLTTAAGYTQQQLQQFLSNSTLKKILPTSVIFASPSCAQHLRQLVRLIDALDVVKLEELLDLYHLAIDMQKYEQLNTHCQGKRCELLHAVSSLAVQLQPEYIEYIAICLCDRLIIGAGKERMQRVIDMHGALVQLIADSDVSRRIAMTILLATFAKISRLELPTQNGDIIALAFDLVKRVDWMRLIVDGCQPDMFALLRSFALIINTHANRLAHPLKDIAIEIHTFFMQLLRNMHFSSKYNSLIMMMERFIVFCIVRGATASCHSTHVFDAGSQSSS